MQNVFGKQVLSVLRKQKIPLAKTVSFLVGAASCYGLLWDAEEPLNRRLFLKRRLLRAREGASPAGPALSESRMFPASTPVIRSTAICFASCPLPGCNFARLSGLPLGSVVDWLAADAPGTSFSHVTLDAGWRLGPALGSVARQGCQLHPATLFSIIFTFF